ncbi:MAG: response regulator [Spirochaetales bacterium]|nr:response regulator [Spirochaetales bacterium]
MGNAKRVVEKYKPQCMDNAVPEGRHYRGSLLHYQARLNSEHNSLTSRSILFVEDELVLRIMVSKMLAHLGYDVMAAMNAERALEMFSRYGESFDILITDVIMPKMDGKELYRVLQKKKNDLRVIYISGYPEEVLLKHGIKPTHINLLKKPFTIEKISQKIKQAFLET